MDRTPSSWRVIRAIAQRETMLAARRRLVKLLFLASVLPPLILTVTIVVRIMAERMTGADLPWDPVLLFLQFQSFPVALLALGIGAPAIARDRAEEVLFLYATRPVLPWHYGLGKMLAVAIPAAALMLLPGMLIAVLRMGVTAQIGTEEALAMIAKLALVAVVTGWAFAGISIGASAATRRGRWALLIAIGVFVIPQAFTTIVWILSDIPLAPRAAVNAMLEAFFEHFDLRGIFGCGMLIIYGTLGMLITTLRVRREMIP